MSRLLFAKAPPADQTYLLPCNIPKGWGVLKYLQLLHMLTQIRVMFYKSEGVIVIFNCPAHKNHTIYIVSEISG